MTLYHLECWVDSDVIICGVFDTEELAAESIYNLIAERKEKGEDWHGVRDFSIVPLELNKAVWLE